MSTTFREKEIFLHVGYPRTGTTTLQHAVFVRQPDLLYIGKPLHYLSKRIATFFTAITERPTLEWERGREAFALEIVRPLLEKKPLPKILISEEELSTGRIQGVDRGVIARRLADLFPEAHVLVTLRRQEDVLASLYCHLRAESLLGPVPFADWLEGQLARFPADNAFTRFDYTTLLEEYGRLFGRDHVHVELYEDFATDPAASVRRTTHVLGVDPDRTARLLDDAGEDRHRNQRLPTIDATFRDGQRERVRAHFAPSNARLATTFALDLGAHGYAV